MAAAIIFYYFYCIINVYYDNYIFQNPKKSKDCSWLEYKYDDDTPYLTIDKYQGKKLIWEVILMKDKAKEFAEEIIKCIEK